jgi:hypothetical protein
MAVPVPMPCHWRLHGGGHQQFSTMNSDQLPANSTRNVLFAKHHQWTLYGDRQTDKFVERHRTYIYIAHVYFHYYYYYYYYYGCCTFIINDEAVNE